MGVKKKEKRKGGYVGGGEKKKKKRGRVIYNGKKGRYFGSCEKNK